MSQTTSQPLTPLTPAKKKASPWPTTAGIELTFSPAGITRNQYEKWENAGFFDMYDENWGATIGKPGLMTPDGMVDKLKCTIPAYHYARCGTDPGVVEISTRILKSWDDMKNTVQTITRKAKKVGLTEKMEYTTGGGGQIHLGVGNRTPAARLHRHAMLRDMSNRPYVCWMFNDPECTDNAKNPWEAIIGMGDDFYSNDRQLLGLSWDYMKSTKLLAITHSKDHVVRLTEDTIEFRFFDMPTSWSQHVLHMEFAFAYFSWIRKRVKAGEKFEAKIRSRKAFMKYNDFDKCVSEFRQLIRDLGLSWPKYRKFVKNLEKRFENEKLLT